MRLPTLAECAAASPWSSPSCSRRRCSVAPATADSRRLAVQVGTYDYLLSPDFDGLVSARAASAGLTLGLGTFDRLDGELVLVGGVCSTGSAPTARPRK